MIVAVHMTDENTYKWCRGTVLSTQTGFGMVSVYLVDLGKTVNVSYIQLRKLAERFRSLDCQVGY